MTHTYPSLIATIGNTPLVSLDRLAAAAQINARILGKIEARNPGGSIKDRVALSMIETAEQKELLQPGGTIIEATSGNTGIGLAWIGRLKGYNVILTMPETMSIERRKLLQAYGATLALTPGPQGMKGSIEKALELQQNTPGSVILSQFDNPANPAVHYRTTGPEIYRDTQGKVDILVSAVGTGGTITGTGRALKELNPNIKIIAVEPAASPVLSGGRPGPHKIQGIGAGFIPANYDPTLVDQVITVTDQEAASTTRLLAATESILAGISSGAALAAAIKIAPLYPGATIATILPDGGERYLSTPLFTT